MKKWLITLLVLVIIIFGGGFFFIRIMENYQVVLQYENIETPLKKELDFTPFETAMSYMSDAKYNQLDEFLENATITEIQEKLTEKVFSCEDLVTYYIINIKKYDVNKLNSIIELNPDALKIARDLDKSTINGKLYGIPVVIKDNIGTSDNMHTTAGASVLRENKSINDAEIVKNLREEGAIILGKANMSEWAYYLSSNAPSGFSALGGQTFNPYGKFDVGGSSSGSAVAVSAKLATVAIGTETLGSIIQPSGQNSVVGIKPTLNIVSQEGIIPISNYLDTAGPITKNVKDAALLLNVLSKDNEGVYRYNDDTIDLISKDGAKKLTIGVVKNPLLSNENKNILNNITKDLEACGFNVKEVDLSMDYDKEIKIRTILRESFENDLNRYFADKSTSNDITLRTIIDFNNENSKERIPYGQDVLVEAVNSSVLSKDELNKVVEDSRKYSRIVLDEELNECSAVISLGNELSNYYSPAGYPAITVPAGYRKSSEPVGVTFIGKEYSENVLINIALTYEQNTKHRTTPNYSKR